MGKKKKDDLTREKLINVPKKIEAQFTCDHLVPQQTFFSSHIYA